MRVFTITAIALASSLVVAGCSGSADDTGAPAADKQVTDLNSVDTDGKADAMAKALPAGDFTQVALGGHVGTDERTAGTTSAMSNEAGSFADLRGFVACPRGMKTCDPKTAPAGTVYTYVLVVYPGGDNAPASGIGAKNSASDIESATAFRMVMPANGFNGVAGYSKPEALAAMGAKADVVISCDAGKLVWTISAGDGGDQWGQKEPITFYWQSTLPPSGRAKAYAFDADGTTAVGEGFYPAASGGAKNACLPS